MFQLLGKPQKIIKQIPSSYRMIQSYRSYPFTFNSYRTYYAGSSFQRKNDVEYSKHNKYLEHKRTQEIEKALSGYDKQTDAKDILDMFLKKGKFMSPSQCARTLTSVSKASWLKSSMRESMESVQRLIYECQINITYLKPKNIAEFILASTHLGMKDPQVFKSISKATQYKMKMHLDPNSKTYFHPSALSTILHRFSWSKVEDIPLFALAAEVILSDIESYKNNNGSLARLVWAYSKTRIQNPKLFSALSDVLDVYIDSNPVAVGSIVFGLAKKGVKNRAMFSKVDELLYYGPIDTFTTVTLVTMLTSFTIAKYKPQTKFFDKVQNVLLPRIDEITDHNLCEIIKSCVKMGHHESALLNASLSKIDPVLEKCEPYNLGLLASALLGIIKSGVRNQDKILYLSMISRIQNTSIGKTKLFFHNKMKDVLHSVAASGMIHDKNTVELFEEAAQTNYKSMGHRTQNSSIIIMFLFNAGYVSDLYKSKIIRGIFHTVVPTVVSKMGNLTLTEVSHAAHAYAKFDIPNEKIFKAISTKLSCYDMNTSTKGTDLPQLSQSNHSTSIGVDMKKRFAKNSKTTNVFNEADIQQVLGSFGHLGFRSISVYNLLTSEASLLMKRTSIRNTAAIDILNACVNSQFHRDNLDFIVEVVKYIERSVMNNSSWGRGNLLNKMYPTVLLLKTYLDESDFDNIISKSLFNRCATKFIDPITNFTGFAIVSKILSNMNIDHEKKHVTAEKLVVDIKLNQNPFSDVNDNSGDEIYNKTGILVVDSNNFYDKGTNNEGNSLKVNVLTKLETLNNLGWNMYVIPSKALSSNQDDPAVLTQVVTGVLSNPALGLDELRFRTNID